MHKAVKEILSIKEDCDYKIISVDEITILRDYITNLQEENKKLQFAVNDTKENADEIICELKEENERLQNILDNIGYQIEGIIRTTEEFGISKNTGEVLSKHNIELLKKILKMIVNKDVSIRSDKE